jgi:probable rRNA maturation factor
MLQIYWDDVPLPETQRLLLERALEMGYANFFSNRRKVDLCEVSVSFLSSDAIRTLNRDYRNMDSETDVLSFPGFAGSPALGDIVICLEVAERQAQEYGHSFERELAFLAVHGLLHLLGYDHDTPEGEAAMCAAQEEILRKVGLGR